MKKPNYGLWVILTEVVGALSGILSREGITFYRQAVEKPALAPPPVLFPIVWTILYGLMGAGAARIAASAEGASRSNALNVYVIQLIVNFFWSPIFFNAQAYGFALFWLILLWALIIGMILLFYKVDKTAALLQLPYLLWVSFAAYLNYGVWQRNG